jgi:hypothetical protein
VAKSQGKLSFSSHSFSQMIIDCRLMKTMRTIYNADTSLEHFCSHNFKFSNINFIDLNRMIAPQEMDEFGINERISSNLKLYYEGFSMSLKILFGETEQDAEVARKRYPRIYFAMKSIHILLVLTLSLFVRHALKRML